jgi:hypothetical protein
MPSMEKETSPASAVTDPVGLLFDTVQDNSKQVFSVALYVPIVS